MKTRTLFTYLLFTVLLVFFTYCEKRESTPEPVACFSASKEDVNVGEEIKFSDCSENVETYSYNFGDALGSSSDASPTYTYNSPGTYTVKLIVFNKSKTDEKALDITVNAQMSVPQVSTSNATAITPHEAVAGGSVLNNGGSEVTSWGVCWSTQQNPDITDNKTEDQVQPGSFISTITGLEAKTTYYVRAYATNAQGTGYGNEIEFTTAEEGIQGSPQLETGDAKDITKTSAFITGNLLSFGEGATSVKSYGHCWSSTSSTPTITNEKTDMGELTELVGFESELLTLSPGKKYYVRAYAINDNGPGYGAIITFETVPEDEAPVVTTAAPENIGDNSFDTGGEVLSDGGTQVTERGIVYSEVQDPTIDKGQKVVEGSGTGTFHVSISNLKQNTKYYARAYATNSTATAYGNEIAITTGNSTTLATVTISSDFNVTSSFVELSAEVTSDGGATVSKRGFVYSKTTKPTTSDMIIHSGDGKGAFSADIANLEPETKYFFRAFAENTEGTSYSAEIEIVTKSNITVPIVETFEPVSIYDTDVELHGKVISDGGSEILMRGICWSTSPNPNITDMIYDDPETTTGEFTGNMYDLTPNTTYYVRAFATNSHGPGYGKEITVTTKETVQYVDLMTPEGGELFNLGESYEVVWEDNSPTSFKIDLYKGDKLASTLVEYAGGSPYNWRLGTTLQPGDDYWMKITNNTDANVYDESGFFTIGQPPTEPVSDHEGNAYNTVRIGNQIWMAENLRSWKDRYGAFIEDASAYDDNDKYIWDYGLLYSYIDVMGETKPTSAVPSDIPSVCPNGWHLPSNSEWELMLDNLAGKDIDDGIYNIPELTNPNGFNLKPGGEIIYGEYYDSSEGIDEYGGYWTTSADTDGPVVVAIDKLGNAEITSFTLEEALNEQISVRCVKDGKTVVLYK